MVLTSVGTIPAPSIPIPLTVVRFRFQFQHKITATIPIPGSANSNSDSNSNWKISSWFNSRFWFYQAWKGIDSDSNSNSGIRIVPSLVLTALLLFDCRLLQIWIWSVRTCSICKLSRRVPQVLFLYNHHSQFFISSSYPGGFRWACYDPHVWFLKIDWSLHEKLYNPLNSAESLRFVLVFVQTGVLARHASLRLWDALDLVVDAKWRTQMIGDSKSCMPEVTESKSD